MQEELISHPFGDLVQQHLARKNGLSKRKLAKGINVDPSVITRICQGKGLSRERIVDIIDWLHKKEVITQLVEANQLLATAGFVELCQDVRKEAAILEVLAPKPTPGMTNDPAELIILLTKANIRLSGSGPESVVRVRGYMESDTTYRELSRNVLRLLQGKRLIDEAHLDVINGKYKELFGVLPTEPLPFDKYNDLDKLKTAILEHWNERHPNSRKQSFDEVVELEGS